MSLYPVEAPLIARYRRPLTFGGVLDETFQLFRRIWLPAAIVVGLSFVPTVVALIFGGGATLLAALSNPAIVSGNDPNALSALVASAFGALLLVMVVGWLSYLVGGAAVTLLSDGAMRDRSIGAASVIGRGFGRMLSLLGASLLFFLAMFGLLALAVPLFFITLFGVLGSLVAIVGLIVWFASPSSRQPWLKWLIILAAPMGLPWYFAVRWALWIPTSVLERAGPMQSLGRSSALVSGNWFKVFGVLFVVGLIVAILQQIVGGIISFVGVIAFGAEPVGRGGQVSAGYIGTQVASTIANFAGSIVFGGIAFIAGTVLYRDLRNRNEGADLAEQVATLEQPGIADAYDIGGAQPIR